MRGLKEAFKRPVFGCAYLRTHDKHALKEALKRP
jgi:hypothetical protein